MITRKIILAILCTFCVTAVLFTIAPTKTATTINSTVMPSSTVTSTNPYDPWVDVTHDGKINVLDLIKVATSLNTNGDPALNVNATNMPPEVDTPVWYSHIVNNTSIFSNWVNNNGVGFNHLNIMAYVPDVSGSDVVYFYVFGALFNAQHTLYYPIQAYYYTFTSSSRQTCAYIPIPSATFYMLAIGSSTTNYHISLSYYETW